MIDDINTEKTVRETSPIASYFKYCINVILIVGVTRYDQIHKWIHVFCYSWYIFFISGDTSVWVNESLLIKTCETNVSHVIILPCFQSQRL